ncbi:multiple epidermal growth factor-like domains protein 10 [Crassostrea angulata]|uniref:multiple epidermal growth factor-like domains protein 10 n=1 Tax=Magallana angulata TaxID=2784310 RepID=UPI0022B201FF|nr:multiple epidermal growth factor-like domains protein 10 [Crassostrea angulata]
MIYNNCNSYLIFCVLYSVFTYDDLSYNKTASQSRRVAWPFSDVSNAKNAVDRNALSCTKAQYIGLNSPDKTLWWKVDLGGVYNIYSVNIIFKNYKGYESRQRGRFAGFSLYVSSTGYIPGSTLCYKDGPELPPLNFTTTCIESGRYVIFYNERLKDIIYPEGYKTLNVSTELCEFIVKGCSSPGVYGNNCDKRCPNNCKDSTCHIQNGTCFACKSGRTGEICNRECVIGWYGENCNRRCAGHCKDGTTCNHVTGQCNEGCDTGWTGFMCDKACQPGNYGKNCSRACSPNCKTCRHKDILCSCKAGWMGDNCTTECIGSYGENCQYPCSVHCINQTCDRFNGNCLCDGKYDNQRNFERTDLPTHPLWMVAFFVSLIIHIIFISATLMSRRKTFLKQKSTTVDKSEISRTSVSNTEQNTSTNTASNYQELQISKNENNYQTLHQE